jgi:S-DNA-T family DNA segregation ATPase FtsK/SpoIIIE
MILSPEESPPIAAVHPPATTAAVKPDQQSPTHPPAPPVCEPPTATLEPPLAPVAHAGFSPGVSELIESHAAQAGTDPSAQVWLDEVTARMRTAIQRREMTAKLLEKKLTPNAALLKFQGTDDLTIPKLEARLSEFKTTDGLDIIALRAELGQISVSIARQKREILYLPDVWKRWKPDTSSGNTSFAIAVKEDDNELLYLSPDPHPHTLVAGMTNSGKSVLIQNIILAIAATNTPDQAQLAIIDPKMGVDYYPFDGLPHLTGATIVTPEDSLRCLQDLVHTMQSRYERLRNAKVQNISQYIRKHTQGMPRIWVIHDEFAMWMQDETYRDNVTSLVNQLSVQARAAGIYLIFAAQRPDNTVFPMQLRSNLGNRLVLKVDSEGTSEVSLGIKKGGADKLLGYGHLAALVGTSPSPIYAQVPFIDGDDLAKFVATIRQTYLPSGLKA